MRVWRYIVPFHAIEIKLNLRHANIDGSYIVTFINNGKVHNILSECFLDPRCCHPLALFQAHRLSQQFCMPRIRFIKQSGGSYSNDPIQHPDLFKVIRFGTQSTSHLALKALAETLFILVQ